MKNIEGYHDGIYCIGNTLVHLDDETEIKNMVEKFYHCCLLYTSPSPRDRG